MSFKNILKYINDKMPDLVAIQENSGTKKIG